MVSIGLTGSLGSGKSFVEQIFRDLGHSVFDADAAAREVVAPGSAGLQEVVREFGSSILREDESLDRAALARVVFGDSQARKRLERIIHPRVREREIEFLRQHRGPGLPVLSIPLLFETGAESLVSHTVVVTINEAQRRERLAQREDRLSPEEIDQRLAAQLPQSEKIERADFVIDNSGSREQTREQVKALCEYLERFRSKIAKQKHDRSQH